MYTYDTECPLDTGYLALYRDCADGTYTSGDAHWEVLRAYLERKAQVPLTALLDDPAQAAEHLGCPVWELYPERDVYRALDEAEDPEAWLEAWEELPDDVPAPVQETLGYYWPWGTEAQAVHCANRDPEDVEAVRECYYDLLEEAGNLPARLLYYIDVNAMVRDDRLSAGPGHCWGLAYGEGTEVEYNGGTLWLVHA